MLSFFRKDPAAKSADRLYLRIVEQARAPALYLKLGAPDTVEGRFEMVALHVWLVLRRLREGNAEAKTLAQAVFDEMFADMDRSLRELGVGDLVVGKKIRKLAENFYGRVEAYETALKAPDAESALATALARNVFETADAGLGAGLARYVSGAVSVIEEQPLQKLMTATPVFPDPVVGAEETKADE